MATGPHHRAEVTRSDGVGPGILDSEWAEGCPAMAACLGQVRTPHLSVVWRVGSTLPEIPQLPTRAGVPPLGRARSAQPLPQFFPGQLGDPVCRGRPLRWFVRVTNAPNALFRGTRLKKVGLSLFQLFGGTLEL